MKILIVDNDKNTVKTMLAAFATEPTWEVDTAYGGEEALQKMRAGAYDLIMLDIMMPKVSGIDVCRAMMADEKLKNIFVVLVSALPVASRSFQDSMENFSELKVVKGVLEKPFDIDDLLSKVKSLPLWRSW